MNINKIAVVVLAGTLFFASCEKDEFKEQTKVSLGKYESGIIILNQGGFGKGNSEISFIKSELDSLQNNVFSSINPDKKLGDTGQSITFNGSNAYIILNGSNTIEVVNRYTFKSVAKIESDLKNPRYMAIHNGKGYITNWGDGGDKTDDYVIILDLITNTLGSKISVAEGPEDIITVNNKIYVAHQGGWGVGKTISVINPNTNTVSKTIEVGDVPSGLVSENNNLYVLCSGKEAWTKDETLGKLVSINTTTDEVSKTINFEDKEHASNLTINNSNLYYTVGNQVYKTPVSSTTLPTTSFIDTNAEGLSTTSSLGVFKDKIFVGDAKNYISSGEVFIYNTSGSFVKKMSVGVLPSAIYWNE